MGKLILGIQFYPAFGGNGERSMEGVYKVLIFP